MCCACVCAPSKELPGQLDSLGYLAFHDGNSTQSPPLGARASSNITPVIVIVVVAVNDSLLLLLPARPPSSHRRRLSRALSTPAARNLVEQFGAPIRPPRRRGGLFVQLVRCRYVTTAPAC
ncbi:hypothetical protein ACCO45_014024 [Purpureocillium lilacinum]|uniref:Uncharacterized protein n=1 Tax=Purpureocillium lilacinum TaxID=33203 RepID=A0ACC4D915_PURLI